MRMRWSSSSGIEVMLSTSRRDFLSNTRGRLIGTLIPDLIVDESMVVDPKVVIAFNENHMAQMIGYLAKTGLEVALLLNFKYARLKWKRVVRSTSL